jgi:hypothetical protein
MHQWLRWSALTTTIAAVLVALAWLIVRTDEPAELPSAARIGVTARKQAANPPLLNPLSPREATEDSSVGALPEAGEDAADTSETGEDMQDASAEAWAMVDLEEVRRAMPDNIYFELSAPTKDEAVLAQRAAERDRWNTEYGKVLSGTATDAEIRAYYDQRARLATDYMEFTTYLLDHYRDTLPERDVGLLELARRLNAARLQEIPRQVEESFERKQQQDEARAAWLADEAEFGKRDPDAQ